MEVYDWLSDVAAPSGEIYDLFEVSFKNGARKEFFRNNKGEEIVTGDWVLVESASIGYDVGKVSLSGELVKLQMRKKNRHRRGSRTNEIRNIIRKARDKEIDKLSEARAREKKTMLRARVMARDLGLDMKLGDVEYQADLRKATFYYTANGRVDFRELIKVLAREFHVKIEMRQIGSRQEAGRVGGIGACGRELCCSTWLTDFKSVNTSAARYQNLAINQTKLSGQCGRLKCCLNYELDTYLEALRDFPDQDKARRIMTAKGEAFLVKTDILKGTMTYQYREISTFYPLSINDVKEIVEMNARGETPEELEEIAVMEEEKEVHEFEDVVGQISLQELQQADRKSKRKRGRNPKKGQQDRRSGGQSKTAKAPQGKSGQPRSGGGRNRRKKGRRRPPKQDGA
jgi:cell fate regulator YaaT (PSP1 superfamily)